LIVKNPEDVELGKRDQTVFGLLTGISVRVLKNWSKGKETRIEGFPSS
jgi:hypothetical protein